MNFGFHATLFAEFWSLNAIIIKDVFSVSCEVNSFEYIIHFFFSLCDEKGSGLFVSVHIPCGKYRPSAVFVRWWFYMLGGTFFVQRFLFGIRIFAFKLIFILIQAASVFAFEFNVNWSVVDGRKWSSFQWEFQSIRQFSFFWTRKEIYKGKQPN